MGTLVQMSPQPERWPEREHYTVVAEPMGSDAWHVTVRELPATWTVAFASADLEDRSRERIALDVGCHPLDFDIRILLELPPATRPGGGQSRRSL